MGVGFMSPQQQLQAFLRRHFSAILIVIGALLLGYVGYEYGSMVWMQHNLQKQWAAQQGQRSSRDAASAEFPDDGLTRLTIPKIDLAAVVVEGTGRKQLLLGPGHMESTAAPGEKGNAVITAHRDTFFRHIYELKKGDEVLVQRNGKTFRYAVQSKRVVDPEDVSVAKQTDDSRLTLITCYPTYYIGPAPQRLVVVSKLVDSGSPALSGASGGRVHKTSLEPAHTVAP